MGADDTVPADWVPDGDDVPTCGELAGPEGWVAGDTGVETGAGD
jgi:hypothetical protein